MSSKPGIHAVTIPKWGMDMAEGTVISWLVEVGDAIKKGAPLLEIESDKIVNEMESPASGILKRRICEEGETHRVGELIGVIADPQIDAAEIDAFVQAFMPVDTAMGAAGSEGEQEPPAARVKTPPDAPRRSGRISPVVRRRAKQLGVDLESVTGTGPGGRITQEDIERTARGDKVPTGKPTTAAWRAQPMSSVRKTIARKLQASKQQIPHFYLCAEYDMDALLHRRDKANHASSGANVSINAWLVAAVAKALADEPRLNAHLVDDEIRLFETVNLGVAVATDDGLIVPVITDAANKTVVALAGEITELATKAREGQLERKDLRGATFTVSNLGMYGVQSFEAIIYPPQVAILALGKVERRPIVRNNRIEKASVVRATLSCDHRVVDGALGAQFLAALRNRIENPDWAL